jgi:hypothetical protein
VLLNLDNIPYVGRGGVVEYRTEHHIARKISEYLSDTEFFYVEFFTGPDICKADIADICTPDILKQIRLGELQIAFHNIHEGFHNISTGIIKFCKNNQIPTENVIIITSNHGIMPWLNRTIERQQVAKPRVVLCEVFEIQSTMILDIFKRQMSAKTTYTEAMDAWIDLTYNPDLITHRYLNLNRRQRSHRVMLVSALLARHSDTHGKISFANSDFGEAERQREIIENAPFYWVNHPEVREQIENSLDDICGKIPMYLDTTELVTNRAASELTDSNLYNTTGISIVSETTFFQTSCDMGTYSGEPGVFLSEKAWKPILHFHPWVMVSQPYTQQALKNYGYQTFSEFWDESYDYETDDPQRMFMILRLIEKMSEWPDRKFKEIISESKPICRHNIDLLHSKQHGKDFIRELT